jgi:O-antigen/teichoic acid export membrane protein
MQTERTAGARARGLRPGAWREALPTLRESETIKAAGLAAAYAVTILLGIVFTVGAARILDESYGALARLNSFYLILTVPGLALQAAVARQVALGELGGPAQLAASLRGWMRHIAVVLAAVTVASVLLRAQLAELLHVDEEWAAASTPVTAMAWLAVCMQRGALQGSRAYVPVGVSIVAEAVGRLVIGLGIGAAGGGVAGTWLGQPLALVILFVGSLWLLRRVLGPPADASARVQMRDLVRSAWVPIVGLTLLAVLQYADVIISGHVFAKAAASDYAAAAVAAKAPYWLALGIALYLLPEATRRAAVGERPLGVLGRSLALLAAAVIPSLAIFAVAAEPVLRIAFGAKLTGAADGLAVLCAAYSMLAAAYLAVQYLLALREVAFLAALVGAAALELVLLPTLNVSLTGYAGLVLLVQSVGAVLLLVMAWRARPQGVGNPEAVVP